jgi:ribosomal protein S18 acetylase RimI-like enzyme
VPDIAHFAVLSARVGDRHSLRRPPIVDTSRSRRRDTAWFGGGRRSAELATVGGGEIPDSTEQTGSMLVVRRLADDDEDWKASALEACWGSTCVARLGELIDAASLQGFVAELEAQRVGLVTFAARHDGVEVVTLQALTEGRGVGRALMDRMRALAVELDAPRLWLTTTNDNIRAFAFYQRWGMDLTRVVHAGVSVSRRVKPSIPELGHYGIALRHELEFELRLQES